MTPLLEQVSDNAEVSEHRCTVLWRHRVFVAAANCQMSVWHALGFGDSLDVLRLAKINVFQPRAA